MDKISSILTNNQPNYKDNGKDLAHSNTEKNEDSSTYRLAEILKTGYQTRKFSNTPTLNWIQTWRVSNLLSYEPK